MRDRGRVRDRDRAEVFFACTLKTLAMMSGRSLGSSPGSNSLWISSHLHEERTVVVMSMYQVRVYGTCGVSIAMMS